MDRLHGKKYISGARSTAQSATLPGDAVRRSEELFEKHVGKKKEGR